MRWKTAVAALPLAVAAAALMQAPPPAAISTLLPPGAMVYVESRDFASLLRDWDASPEQKLWLASDAFQVFSRSRLYQRLGDAQGEFAQAAGVPPDVALLKSVSGGESAIAIYDIGKLEFIYMTRLASAGAIGNALWQSRSKFEPRNAAGQAYYVRTDPVSHRTVAFAAAGGYLLLATREDLVSGAVTRIAGQPAPSLADQQWFAGASKAGGAAGELRMVMNLEGLVATPYFRSYWIQRNVSAIREYSAGVADIRRAGGEVREDRVLLRRDPGERKPADPAPVAALLRLAPPTAGLYRAWVSPAAAQVADLIRVKVLAPEPSVPPPSDYAPGVTSTGAAGSDSDLETRIDETPLGDTSGSFAGGALASLLQKTSVQAVLDVESSRPAADQVFVQHEAVIVLAGAKAWDAAAVKAALAESVRSLYTASALGLNWTERVYGREKVEQTEGLQTVAVAVRGNLFFLSNSGTALAAVLERTAQPPGQPAAYAAGFRHTRERANFVRMTRMIERPQPRQGPPQAEPQEGDDQQPAGAPRREPMFFSEHLGSLSRTLGRVESVTLSVRDTGPTLTQTVLYRMTQ